MGVPNSGVDGFPGVLNGASKGFAIAMGCEGLKVEVMTSLT